MTKNNRKILSDKEFIEMMETRYGEVTLEFEKDGSIFEGRIVNIPLKYFLVDILDDFIKDIICDLYNEGWDFSKEINFLEIVGE